MDGSEHVLRPQILLIDFNPAGLQHVARLIRDRMKLEAQTAASLDEARLRIMELGSSLDLVLLAQSGNGRYVSGLDWFRRHFPAVPVIVLGLPGAEAEIAALEAGAYAGLSAPLHPKKLYYSMHQALMQRQLYRERQAITFLNTLLSKTHCLDQVLRVACRHLVRVFQVDHSAVLQIDPRRTVGRAIAEYPDRVDMGVTRVLGTQVPIQGVAVEEQVFFHKQMQAVPDVANEPGLGPVRDILLGFKIQSLLIVPIIVDGQVVASISLDSIRQPRHFTQAEQDLCRKLAGQLAVALRNARLYQKQQEDLKLLQALQQASREVISTQEPRNVLTQIVQQVRKVILSAQAAGDVKTAALMIDEGGYLRSSAWDGGGPPQDGKLFFHLPETCQVFDLGRPGFLPDCSLPGSTGEPAPAACLPLVVRGRRVGVLWIVYPPGHEFSDIERQALPIFANEAAAAFDQASRLYAADKLRQATEALVQDGSLRQVQTAIANGAVQVLNAQWCLVWPYDSAKDRLDPENLVSIHLPEKWVRRFRADGAIIGRTTRHFLEAGYDAVEDLAAGPLPDYIGDVSRAFLRETGVRALQGICLKVGEEKLGVLYLDYGEPRCFSEDEVHLLEQFASQAALKLKQARSTNALIRAWDAATRVTESSVFRPLRDTLHLIAQSALDRLGTDIVTLYSYDQDQQLLVDYAAAGSYAPGTVKRPDQLDKTAAIYRIILSPEPFELTEDTETDTALSSSFTYDNQIQAILAIPLRLYEKTNGILFVNYQRPHHFTDDEITNALHFARQAAVFIHNTQLRESYNRTSKMLKGLIEAMYRINSRITDLDAVLNDVARAALDAIRGGVHVRDCYSHVALLDDGKLYFRAASSPEILHELQTRVKVIDFSPGSQIGIAGRAVLLGRLQNVPDVSLEQDYIGCREDIRSQISALIMTKGKVAGVLSVETSDAKGFTKEDEYNLQGLATQAGIAIENATLYQERDQALKGASVLKSVALVGLAQEVWAHNTAGLSASLDGLGSEINLLKERIKLALPASDQAQPFQAGLERMQSLVKELQNPPGMSSLNPDEAEVIDLNQVLPALIDHLWDKDYRQVFPEYSKIQKWTEVNGEVLPVQIGVDWLREVIYILANNSARAMKHSPHPRFWVETRAEAGWAEIRFQDTGCGIPPEIYEQVFFNRIQHVPGSRDKGMGLSIAWIIINAFGGKISIPATSAQGTTVLIQLPLLQADLD